MLTRTLMIYTFLNLQTAGWIVGLLLVGLHAVALINQAEVQRWLRAFPRSLPMGKILLSVAALWSFGLIKMMDLGEFTHWRMTLLLLIPAAYVLCIMYVDEFLAVRAAGMLALLAAEPVLEAAFLRHETSRLLLVLLAFVWVVLGLFWVGTPYVMRDQISWVLQTTGRWKSLCIGGLLYGLAILICSATLHRSV